MKTTAQQHLSQMMSVNVHQFLQVPPQLYSHMQTVGVGPGTVKNKETAPLISPLVMPYLSKSRFSSKPKAGR